eukprot:COSAG01_NODE_14933_length_1394_cov_1.044015_4_plen_55_part_00
MGREMDGREMDAALAEIDRDGGGDVDFDEFARWWSKQVGWGGPRFFHVQNRGSD